MSSEKGNKKNKKNKRNKKNKKNKMTEEYLINTIEISTWENELTFTRTYRDVVSAYLRTKFLPLTEVKSVKVSNLIFMGNHNLSPRIDSDVEVVRSANIVGPSSSSLAELSAANRLFTPSISTSCLSRLKSLRRQQEESMKTDSSIDQNKPSPAVTNHNGTDFYRHISTHSTVKRFQCPRCEHKYHRISDLSQHLRSHSDEKPYTCDVCNKGFSGSYALKKHQAIHSAVKRFKCLQCEYTCHTSSGLTQHVSKHSGEKPFACNVCSNTFSSRSDLKRHEQTHSAVKRFKCPHCEYKAHTKRLITRHLPTHEKERPPTFEVFS